MAWLNSLLLKSTNPQLRRWAIEGLTGSGKSRDTDRFVASLNDKNPQVRCAAVRALEKVNNKDSARSLAGALRDSSYEVREAAARALGRLGAMASTPPLAASLRDPDSGVRAAAAAALRALAWRPSTNEELARFEIILGNTPAPVPVGEASLDPLVADLKHDTTFQRRAAAEAMKEVNDPRKIRPLLAALADNNDASIRLSAIDALRHATTAAVTEELLKLFRDRNTDVRLAAAQVLATRNDPPPAHFLGLLDDAHPEIRLAAVQFLGRIRHPHIASVLIPLLFDSDADVRQATATALGLIGSASAIEPLTASQTDKDPLVRQAVERALEKIKYVQKHRPTQAAAARR